jgi:hypothetical protein
MANAPTSIRPPIPILEAVNRSLLVFDGAMGSLLYSSTSRART